MFALSTNPSTTLVIVGLVMLENGVYLCLRYCNYWFVID